MSHYIIWLAALYLTRPYTSPDMQIAGSLKLPAMFVGDLIIYGLSGNQRFAARLVANSLSTSRCSPMLNLFSFFMLISVALE